MRTRTWGGSGSEWEYEGSDEEDDLELSPTTGRVRTPPERHIKHGTVERDAAYCSPCLAEAEAFNITDVDGGQPTGMLHKIRSAGSASMTLAATRALPPQRSQTVGSPGVPMGRCDSNEATAPSRPACGRAA
eukprot:jgi/Tetstr1/433697/TSEL_022916.t1